MNWIELRMELIELRLGGRKARCGRGGMILLGNCWLSWAELNKIISFLISHLDLSQNWKLRLPFYLIPPQDSPLLDEIHLLPGSLIDFNCIWAHHSAIMSLAAPNDTLWAHNCINGLQNNPLPANDTIYMAVTSLPCHSLVNDQLTRYTRVVKL